MTSSSAGLLLLLVAFIGIAGFLTGNLDHWLGVLFTPPAAAAPTASTTNAKVTIGSATQRSVA